MQKRPKILITNDDGIHAPGIRHLWQALEPIADLAIMAPNSERSGTALTITGRHPVTVKQIEWPGETLAWSVNGTPVDCVKIALTPHIGFTPDLVVSGINCGSNAGRTLLYSGTVAGVIEALLHDIPGIAFSCYSSTDPEYRLATDYIQKIVKYVLENPLPLGTFLNVTFPETNGQPPNGVKLTRQGCGRWVENPDRRTHPEGATYYWINLKNNPGQDQEDTDTYWVEQGYVTVAPVHIAELTDHKMLRERKNDIEQLFPNAFFKEESYK